MKKSYAKRFSALLLIVVMILSFASVSAFAQESPDTTVSEEPTTSEQENGTDVPAEEPVDPDDVTTAEQLEAALLTDAEKIRITASFEIDRTYFITRDVTIYSTEAYTLTRAADFTGDMFVIAETAEGEACAEKVILSVGTKDTENSDMLTINGNSENMTVPVTGTVFFVCKNGQADLYPDLTVTNCKKTGNDRALNVEKYTLCSDRTIIGGPVGIVVESKENGYADGIMNVYGGKYTNNGVADSGVYGGVIFNHSKLNVYDGLFENNYATRAGVFYNYRRMNLYKATVSNNSATKLGGAIYLPASSGAVLYLDGGAKTEVAPIVFKNNSAETAGAISCSGTLVIRNALFEGNTATSSAGAVYGIGTYNNVTVYDSIFTKNVSGENGGALYVAGKRESVNVAMEVKNSSFTENKAVGNGGAIYAADPANAYIKNVDFSKNSSDISGGAVYLLGTVADINDVTFTGNTAGDNGGALYMHKDTEDEEQEDGTTVAVDVPAQVVINDITAISNSAAARGGAISCGKGNLKIYNSTLKENTAATGGSAVYFGTSAEADIYNSIFEGNSCPDTYTGNAGAFFLNTSGTKITLHTCTLKDNVSSGLGGGILVTGPSLLDLFNITATGNSAAKGGFMYETKANTVVTVSGLTVSGNTATTGGPIIWGNTPNAKLYINKNNYTDSDVTTELDDTYWAAAIYNKLTVSDSDAAVPEHDDYTKPEFDTDEPSRKGHTYTSAVTKAATCTEEGVKQYTCYCGDTYTVTIDALGHDEVAHDVQAPTCTEIGRPAHITCTRCDYTTYNEADEIDKLGHDEVYHDAQAPTCTEIGWEEYVTCTRCDYTTYAEKSALGHDEVSHEAQEPTCEAIGWDAYETCTRCDYTTYAEKSALGHDEIAHEAQAPACEAIGWDAYETCSRCDYTTYVEKPMLGHDKIAHEAQAPTCEGIGWDAYETCSRCDYTTYSELPKLGHSYETKVTAPTCTEKGYTTYTCPCGDTYTADEVVANGHSWKAATCTAAKTCTVCKATDGKALGHSYKDVITKATLSKNGKVESKCSACGSINSTATVYYPKTISLEYTSYTYNGKTKTPAVTVKNSKGNTISKDNYTVSYASGRKNTGKYSVTITFKGSYSGKKVLYFNILPSKTSKITPTSYTTSIKASWSKVTGASGYKVELLNSKGKVVKTATTTKTAYTFKELSKVTTYKIRVTAYKTIDGKKVYSKSSTTITTSTAPAKVTLSKVTAGSKSATPYWKTVSGASGYEVQYSTSSKFKSAKTATVKKGSSKKTTIKKLAKGKKYYFKVRAYKTVDGKKVYGSWSAVKSVKVK